MANQEKPKVYCKDCRFLRQPIKKEKRHVDTFFGEERVFFCSAPKNLIRYSNFMSWELSREQHPAHKNKFNNCPDFETVKQAVGQKSKL